MPVKKCDRNAVKSAQPGMFALLLGLWMTPVLPAQSGPVAPAQKASAAQNRAPAVLDSKQLEKELQALPWPQFRKVIESIPKLKADVEAYGSAGWQFVKAKYPTHAWKKNIDRLNDEEKRQLAKLIQDVRKIR
jgi:hypothetical protein